MAPVFHFTHGKNLPGILTAGELRCHAFAESDTVVEVADSGVKRWRQERQVSCGPGGRVCDYVPFYFAPRSPMLYKISKGEVEGVDRDQRPLIYLVSSTEQIVTAGLRYVFSDGNAAKLISAFHDDVACLESEVSWDVIRARQWGNTDDDGDRVRRRMAEFLVHGALPLSLVSEIGVYDRAIRGRVREFPDISALGIPVNVRCDWYF